MWTDRTEILFGQEGLEKLKKSRVAVVGIGGVGGYVALMLARAGVENLVLVDFDKVDETNINRQVVATTKTVGSYKTLVMKQMIEEINPKCNIETFEDRFCKETAENILSLKIDYVVDAIDSVKDKVELICCCKQKGINIVSAMGAGNRKNIPQFKVLDIYKTSNDGLAKVMRKKLRESNIESLDVVASEEKGEKTEHTAIGSVSYYPAMCGCVLSAFVINKISE
ncbi:MAG: tRNA threonylcarbamoyladenosine dehydratase [Clostridiales bacterium]|nr:tRNA threonylcarbamoyladenosine dehydratase [Clostridiales bacterium]